MFYKIFTALLFCCCFGIPSKVEAQIQHDVKTRLVAWVGTSPSVFWELHTRHRISYELGIEYDFSTISMYHSSNTQVLQAPFRYRRDVLDLFLAARYYFFPIKGPHNMYLGLATRYRTNQNLDPQYEKVYQFLHNKPSGVASSKDLLLAPTIGYKWIIKERFLLEPEILYGLEFSWLDGHQYLGFTGDLRLKIGYRFSSKNKSSDKK